MPLISLKTSVPVPADKQDSLLKSLSAIIAEKTGKPEEYVMVTVEEVAGCLAGEAGPIAFADVRGIGGLDRETNANITAALCELLSAELDVPPASVYAVFTDIAAPNWGCNSKTFG